MRRREGWSAVSDCHSAARALGPETDEAARENLNNSNSKQNQMHKCNVSLLLTSPLQRCSFSTKENTISSLSLSLEGITKVQNNDNDKEHTQIQIVIGRDRGGHIHIYMLLVVEVVVVVVII